MNAHDGKAELGWVFRPPPHEVEHKDEGPHGLNLDPTAAARRGSVDPRAVIALQASAGNAAVAHLLGGWKSDARRRSLQAEPTAEGRRIQRMMTAERTSAQREGPAVQRFQAGEAGHGGLEQ
ncbi:MAG: hypothetical protein M3N98_14415, partial [Actinomycetota bacterium]|nr:hypothetical protein [Actinomycetota bacterium]